MIPPWQITLNETQDAATLRNAGLGVLFTFTLNLIASLMMAGVLGPATIATPDTMDRVSYISANQIFVQLGWASWAAATLSLVLFFLICARLLDSRYRGILSYATILAAIGAAPDCISDMISLSVIPDLATRIQAAVDPVVRAALLEQFHTWDGFSVVLTGGLGNTCYGLAGCLLTFAIFRSKEFNVWLRFMAFPLWAFTFWMSYGSFALDASVLPFAVGITMGIFLIWSFLIGLGLLMLAKQRGSA